MSLLQNKDWNAVRTDQRIIGKSLVLCSLGEVREDAERDTKPKDGEPVLREEQLVVPLSLEQEAKTIDGEVVKPGFPLTARLRVWSAKNGEPLADNMAKANEISERKIKQLMLAALGLKRNDKADVGKTIQDQGGWPALNGRKVLVNLDVTESKGTKYQEIVGFSAAPAGAPVSNNPY
jgi:hypothetical protein